MIDSVRVFLCGICIYLHLGLEMHLADHVAQVALFHWISEHLWDHHEVLNIQLVQEFQLTYMYIIARKFR